MSRKKKSKSSSKGRSGTRPSTPARPSRVKLWWCSLRERHGAKIRRRALIVLAVGVAGLAVAVGLQTMERDVLARRATGPSEFRLRLANRPEWMPESLARQLVIDLTPPDSGPYDRDLPAKVYDLAVANPWIRQVTWVRRHRNDDPNVATIDLHADFRKPIACIGRQSKPAFVSADGFHLPTHQVPRWVTHVRRSDGSQRQVCFVTRQAVPPGVRAKPIHYVKISGVRRAPPGYGKKWPGLDLDAGVQMVALVVDRPYVNQIAVADVRNYAGRGLKQGQAHLAYYAQVGRSETTEIRFGRFPEPGGDYNVQTERKLSYLDAYVARNKGRLAGLHSYIELRFDGLHVSVH